MNRSLSTKLALIMILVIVSLMVVVGAFLMLGIRDYFINEFYDQMKGVFTDERFVDELCTDAGAENPMEAAKLIATKIGARAGLLGIDSGARNCYILDGATGAPLAGLTDLAGEPLEITPNILRALTGVDGTVKNSRADYMDVALVIKGEMSSYIVYIRDNRERATALSEEMFKIILTSLLIGLVISVILSLIMSRTMTIPIRSLTGAAERLASGDFSSRPSNAAKDEIGVLTNTFNNMATQLENTLRDLRKSEMMRREFVANVSHELRTPITSIRSYAETLEDTRDIPEDTQLDFLRVIVNESDRMTNIVADLLTLSRFDAGSFEFSFGIFSFEKAVRDVYNAMAIEAGRRGHDFRIDIQGKIPEIRGDRLRIEQVLMNMISNAIKYTPDGGLVEVIVSASNGEARATVRDNGIGISEEDAPRVFERFYRVDKARSRESGGTGLGLAIAQEIILRHGGEIDLQSKKDEGTEISISLPVGGPPDAA